MEVSMEVSELFNQLESNQTHLAEEVKKHFHKILNSNKESWIVNGLIDYCLATNSVRAVDILVSVREPHDKHLFDRLLEVLRSSSKVQGLTFLGHIVRRHPTWLYKITNHQLLKELLKLLKTETDIIPLMSTLLIIIILLPMIPALIGPYLSEIFEVFSRLAAWNTNNPNKLPEEHLLHLQVGLYALFHRLYGMYPCNFLAYLRHEYGQRERLLIFSHTIKPMLDTVKMHPLLVTASKDAETATARWKKMEHHDVVVECAKFALDTVERSHEGLNMSVRSNLDPSKHLTLLPVQNEQVPSDKDIWSPSRFCGLETPPLQDSAPASIPQTPNSQCVSVLPSQEGTSPPEAAIEATPETTPIKDTRHIASRLPPASSSAARALGTFGNISPGTSQPSSPLKKEPSPFHFPGEQQPRRDSLLMLKIQRIQQERLQVTETTSSPLTVESATSADWAPEDQEVLEIVKQGEDFKIDTQSRPQTIDSVLQDFHPPHVEDYDECTQDTCPSGGLHMPPSRSMLDLAHRVHQHRQRYYSECSADNFGKQSCVEAGAERTTTGTQTVDYLSPPYEHLFMGVVPGPVHVEPQYSPYAKLNAYLDKILKDDTSEVQALKDQLLLFNIQLNFERHRREVHAERNRRLMSKSRSHRSLEEHNSALRDQLSLLQKEIENLHGELEKSRKLSKLNEEQLQETVTYWQNQYNNIQKDMKELKIEHMSQGQELEKAVMRNRDLDKELQQVQAKLFTLSKERSEAASQANAEQLKVNLDHLNKELLLIGELQNQYREHFTKLNNMHNYQEEISMLKQTYNNETKVLRENLEIRSSALEAAKCRNIELESLLIRKDQVIADQKRMLKVVKDDCAERIVALESKYTAQKAINHKLEEVILYLQHCSEQDQKSPDACSISSGEKQLGPNSPLSESLASTEGLSLLGGHAVEMKNLEMLVDQPLKQKQDSLDSSTNADEVEDHSEIIPDPMMMMEDENT